MSRAPSHFLPMNTKQLCERPHPHGRWRMEFRRKLGIRTPEQTIARDSRQVLAVCAGSSFQACSRHLFENGDGSGFPRHHRFGIDKKGLLQRILPAKHCVGNGLGVDHPTGTRRKLNFFPYATRLERRIFLHGVVQAHHELVVRPALPLRNEGGEPGSLSHPLACAYHRAIGSRNGELARRERSDHSRERLADHPVARARGMNVMKEAQDSPATRRPRRKSIV